MKWSDERLPWPQLTEIALGILGLSPEAFWAMTPTEWLAALSGWKRKYGITETPVITREEVQMMAMRFPD